MGSYLLNFLKVIDTVGFLSFSSQVLLKQLLKFLLNSLPSLLRLLFVLAIEHTLMRMF